MAFKKSKSTSEKKFEYKIIEDYGAISSTENGYELKLTYTSWNGNEPKYDIRPWKEDRGYKGITFTGEEFEKLYEMMKKIADED